MLRNSYESFKKGEGVMRIKAAIPALALLFAVGFSSNALAGDKRHSDDKTVKVKKVEHKTAERTSSSASTERWDRGEWTTNRETVNGSAVDNRWTSSAQPAGPSESRAVAGRQSSGPYRYFYTDHEGKYNYFLDRYDYPHRYGGSESDLPIGVLGYVPPEQMGGGPVLYFRPERPLSRSAFDGAGGLVD